MRLSLFEIKKVNKTIYIYKRLTIHSKMEKILFIKANLAYSFNLCLIK